MGGSGDELKFQTSYMQQLRVLISRNAKNAGSELFTTLNFVQAIVLAIIAGLCWYQMPLAEHTVMDRLGMVRP